MALSEAFLLAKAERINAALRKINAPFMQECSTLKDKSEKDKPRITWRRVSESCLPGGKSMTWVSEKTVEARLQKDFHTSLRAISQQPERAAEKALKEIQKANKKKEEAEKAKADKKAGIEKKKEDRKKAKDDREAKKNSGYEKIGEGKFQDKIYAIYKKHTGSGERYFHLNKKGQYIPMLKKQATAKIEDFKKLHKLVTNGATYEPKHETKTETKTESKHKEHEHREHKPKAAAPTAPPTPPATVKEAIRKIARLKPEHAGYGRMDFQEYVKNNFKALKQQYAEGRKHHEYGGGYDFLTMAMNDFKLHQKAQKMSKTIKHYTPPPPQPPSVPEYKPAPAPVPAKTGGDYSKMESMLDELIKRKLESK